MDDPKVTLLGNEWQDYTFVFGKKRFIFRGGETRPVPPAVALVLSKRKSANGHPLFKVEKMPEVIVPLTKKETASSVQNAHGHLTKKVQKKSLLSHVANN